MKTQTLLRSLALLCLFAWLFPNTRHASKPSIDSTNNWMQPWLYSAESEFQALDRAYFDLTAPLIGRRQDVNKALKNT